MTTGMRGLGLALVLLLTGGLDASAQRRTDDKPGEFDFYVLALSWSPTYCEANGARSTDQCGRSRSFAFVVHGLWPQYDRGFPDFCDTTRRGEADQALVTSMLDIMPARALVRHEWDKHGTCSGLDAKAYFDLTRKAYADRVKIPGAYKAVESHTRVGTEELEQAFLDANPGLPRDAIAVTCSGNRLREVRICLSKDLAEFRPCRDIDRNACRRESVVMPPSRRR